VNAHPSQYTLDRAALGASVAPPDAAHLSACARCAAVVASRRAAPPRPAWLDDVRLPPAAPRPRLPWLRWVALLPVATAAVAALVLLPGDRRPVDGPEGIRAKGTPSVAVYLKRADAVVAWDGRAPLRTGDRIRLGVRGAGYGYVSVASIPPAPAQPGVLYSGALSPEGETLLPIGFRVDDRGETEQLSVVLAAKPVGEEEHRTLPGPDRIRATWTTRITLPKEARR
jgi:hypothetical protein